MFCLHHDEADLYGADRVPCPLCGFGAGSDAIGHALGFEPDAEVALREAFDLEAPVETEGPRPLHLPRHYW